MDNINYMMNVINRDAVFAQLDLKTTGTAFDENVELFRRDRARRKCGIYTDTLTFEDLAYIAKDLFNERKRVYSIGPARYGLTEEECGEYAGFSIKLIFDGGCHSHFDIDADGNCSQEFEGWNGTIPINSID